MSTMVASSRGTLTMYLLFAALGGGLVTFFLTKSSWGSHLGAPPPQPAPLAQHKPSEECPFKFVRLHGYSHLGPLISAEPECPSAGFDPMMLKIAALADSFKNSGAVRSVSVYIRSLEQPEWSVYNGLAEYDPGSMMKVAVLITLLRMEEEDPGLLRRSIRFTQPVLTQQVPDFPPEKTMMPTSSYTYEELIERMVKYSDNEATALLMSHLDMSRFRSLFSDLGMPYPDSGTQRYLMTARQYSIFMKALYHGTLLSLGNSEKALTLLTQCTFKDGLVNGLPPGVEVAHKFGETQDQGEGMVQLHEAGIVFDKDGPYLLTVMTEGPRMDALPGVISAMAACAHANMPR